MERDLEPPWQAYGYVQWHCFLYIFTCFENNEDKIINNLLPKNTLHIAPYILFLYREQAPNFSITL